MDMERERQTDSLGWLSFTRNKQKKTNNMKTNKQQQEKHLHQLHQKQSPGQPQQQNKTL